ncbi:MAG: sulfite dehydrogenase (cytochrome) subunit SorA apoprotein [Polaromonas sp.]|nr:sulfite dehydrogenase (cytochrome) subunit SorA apoprotein [Polaromonas sp.]
MPGVRQSSSGLQGFNRFQVAIDSKERRNMHTQAPHQIAPALPPLALNRRHLLAGSASALAAVGLSTWTQGAAAQAKALPAYASWKDVNSAIVHIATTIETKRGAFGTSVITPAEQLYIRNNLPAPDASIVADRDAWEIAIEGVSKPRKLSLRELKTLGLETVAMVLQCSGNGRGFFPSKPSGTPWTVGAAGCVVWSGVPVRVVAEALGGLESGMRFMTGTGGEKLPDGLDPKSIIVERSVPAAAMADALLAWEMNGAAIPLAHGGPLRLIVPGYTGINNIKYIKQLAFTAQETDAKIMSHGYRISPPGEKGDPNQPSVQEMTVKSWINSPSPDAGLLEKGRVQISGVAFGGLQPVKRVEVSVDGGKNWIDARFVGPDLGKYAWRQFVLETRLLAGQHMLASRATDVQGNVQPQQRLENAAGYNNTSWADHAVAVKVA